MMKLYNVILKNMFICLTLIVCQGILDTSACESDSCTIL